MAVDTKEKNVAQRRAAVRAEMSLLSCTIWLPAQDICQGYAARVVNVSAGGMLVETPVGLPADTTVRCHLYLEGDGWVVLWGRSVRAGGTVPPFHVGLQFVLNDEGKRDRVHRWVHQALLRLRQRYGHR